jgi:hypothetical protein
MHTQLDDLLEKLPLEDRLELVRRVRVGSLLLRVGDRVEAGRRLRGSYVDEDLEAEGEDCRIPYDVPAGTLGRVIRVRQYITPFPYDVPAGTLGRVIRVRQYITPFPYDVPAGTLGRVIRVRQYITPFPYAVAFDSSVDLNLAVGDVVRVAEQPSEREREQDGALWHIPPGELFTIRCSRWIDRVGCACPQLRLHRGPCGLPPR